MITIMCLHAFQVYSRVFSQATFSLFFSSLFFAFLLSVSMTSELPCNCNILYEYITYGERNCERECRVHAVRVDAHDDPVAQHDGQLGHREPPARPHLVRVRAPVALPAFTYSYSHTYACTHARPLRYSATEYVTIAGSSCPA